VSTLNDAERRRAQTVIEDGLLVCDGDHLILTDPGRLLADAVVRTLLD
jgi:coproporphyrinogen III oxidase-like Fe-S oxidoreductase